MKQRKPILGLAVCGALVVAAAMGLPALAKANLKKDQDVVFSNKIEAGGGTYQAVSSAANDAATAAGEPQVQTLSADDATTAAKGPQVRALSAEERKPFEKMAREALARDLGYEVPGDYVCTASGVADDVRIYFSPKGTLSETNDALIGADAPAVVVYQAMFGGADTKAGTGSLNTLQRLNMGDAVSKNVLSMSGTITDEEIAFYDQKARAHAQEHETALGARLEAIPVSGSFDVGAMITFEDKAGGTMTYLVSQTGEVTGYSMITPKG